MQKEIEVKFVNVNHDVIRKQLQNLGAQCEQPMRLMRRQMFDHPDRRFANNALPERLRVRDEGNKVTMTYKIDQYDSNYSDEVEIIVDSFENAVKLLESVGLVKDSLMESKRETWRLDNVEVVLDEWPWLSPYIEIEGHSEEAIKSVTNLLDLEWSKAVFGSVDVVYRLQYPGMKKSDSINDLKQVRFDMDTPQFFTDRSKAN